MVTSSAARERQDLRLGWLWASAFLHASIIMVVAEVRSDLPRAEPVTPTQLVGGTFDVLVDDAGRNPAAAEPAAASPSRALPDAASAAPRADAPSVARPSEPARRPTVTLPSAHDAQLPQRGASEDAPSPSVAQAAASPPTGNASSPRGATAYGQEGKEGAPAQLRRAFIKTLPLAAKLDPGWLGLPAMSLGRGRFVLRLNEQGQLTSVDVRSGDAHSALVRAMQKNRAFLGLRRFASAKVPGERSIVVDVSGQVSQKAPQLDAEGKVIALGVRVDPQDPQAEPRGAYFTYDTGQHVELSWTVVVDPATRLSDNPR